MNLEEQLNSLVSSGTSSRQNDAPYKKLKNGTLYTSRKTPELLVRILPPAQQDKMFYQKYKEFGAQVNGKWSFITLGSKPTEMLNNEISNWSQMGMSIRELRNMPQTKKFKLNLRTNFYLNAVPLKQTTVNGQLSIQMERDNEGKPKVYLLRLSNTQMKQLSQSLADKLKNPNIMPVYRQMAQAHNITITQEQADWSFISSVLAYPVKITVGQSLSSPSRVDVETVSVLPPLPAGWENSLEDLQYQATPTSEYAPNYVAKIITTIDSAIGAKQAAPTLNNNAGTTAYAHMQTAPAASEAPNTASDVSATSTSASANANPFSNVQKPVQSPALSKSVQQDDPFGIPEVKSEQEEDASADPFASSKVDTPVADNAADAVKDDGQSEQASPDAQDTDTQDSDGVQTPDDILNTMPDYLKEGLEGIK
jgi:hypothetical protein